MRTFHDLIESIRPYIRLGDLSAVEQNILAEFEREYARGAASVVERARAVPRQEINYHCKECGYHGRIKLRRLQ